jgi:hypothetical protein
MLSIVYQNPEKDEPFETIVFVVKCLELAFGIEEDLRNFLYNKSDNGKNEKHNKNKESKEHV